MNIALSLLNAAALVALVTLHFQGDGSDNEQVSAQARPHHLLRQTPQLAIMTDQQPNSAMLANDKNDAMPMSINQSERWVF